MPHTLKRKIEWGVVAASIVVITGYALLRSHDLVSGVALDVTSIHDGMSLRSAILPIEGIAKRATTLLVDNRPLTVDKEGRFKDTLVLGPGVNVITLAARDKFGKETTETFHVVLLE